MNLSMNDLISREAAIDVASYECHEWRGIFGRIKDGINNLPSAEPLTEEDYIELRDRFGEYVEFVVRDMISGKGERWK